MIPDWKCQLCFILGCLRSVSFANNKLLVKGVCAKIHGGRHSGWTTRRLLWIGRSTIPQSAAVGRGAAVLEALWIVRDNAGSCASNARVSPAGIHALLLAVAHGKEDTAKESSFEGPHLALSNKDEAVPEALQR